MYVHTLISYYIYLLILFEKMHVAIHFWFIYYSYQIR